MHRKIVYFSYGFSYFFVGIFGTDTLVTNFPVCIVEKRTEKFITYGAILVSSSVSIVIEYEQTRARAKKINLSSLCAQIFL